MPTKNQLQKALDECRANRATDKETISKQADEIAGLKLALADCKDGEPEPPPPPPPSGVWRPYSDASPFNVPITNRTVHADSQNIMNQVWAAGKYPSKINITQDWTRPVYFAKAGDPEFTIRLTEPWGTNPFGSNKYRIPNAAKQGTPPASSGGDAHLCAIDTERDIEVHLWQVQQKPSGGGQLVASWGGLGKPSGPGIDYPAGTMGNATAAHFGIPLGLLTPEELVAGDIRHAFISVVPHVGNRQDHVFPAQGKASQASGWWPILGQRLALDCTEDYINGRQIPAYQKTILRCMRRYGMFIGDTGGGANPSLIIPSSSLNETSYGKPNPWLEAATKLGIPLQGGYPSIDLTNACDWNMLKVLA